MYEIRRVSFSKGNSCNIERWLDRIIEDTILQQINITKERELSLRIIKHKESLGDSMDRDGGGD